MDPLLFSITVIWTGLLLMVVGEAVPEVNNMTIRTTEINILFWAGMVFFLTGVGLYIGAP